MCGICGIVTFCRQQVSPLQIKKMINVIKHWGPDDKGIFIDGNLGLGHTRLNIVGFDEQRRKGYTLIKALSG